MTKISRNAPCPCGSGLKYKRCCEAKDAIADIDPEVVVETLENTLSDLVYRSTLLGIWTFFNPNRNQSPSLEAMEDFYYEVYGYELDRDTLDELVLPLPASTFKGILPSPMRNPPSLDLAPEPETPSLPSVQPDLFPGPKDGE